ncbi:MAG TPA: SPOR domain-containing protein [Bacteroidetes bacterium]|nr:SPOR domain-containing protein [Bacteroidota bacterium]
MYLRISIIIIIIFFFTGLKAQNIYVNEEPAIKKLYNNFISWNKEKKYVNGWRIQIINTDDRRKMEKAISSFRYHFPNIRNVSWEQVSPYYRVKVSGFDSKLKAQAFLDQVKEFFPSAITVWEKIDESEFIESVD